MSKDKNERKDKYPCPVCKKRVFDARDGDEAVITLRCLHCREIVEVPVFTRDKPPNAKRDSYG